MNDAPEGLQQLGAADVARLMKLLPHRFPFLLVDRMFDMDRDESAVGLKNVTINEPFFQGHFPEYPVMPGVLIIEGLAPNGRCALCAQSRRELHPPPRLFYGD